jgi:hypothetical protein
MLFLLIPFLLLLFLQHKLSSELFIEVLLRLVRGRDVKKGKLQRFADVDAPERESG